MISIRENLISNKSDNVNHDFHFVLEVSMHAAPVPFGTLSQNRSASLALGVIPGYATVLAAQPPPARSAFG